VQAYSYQQLICLSACLKGLLVKDHCLPIHAAHYRELGKQKAAEVWAQGLMGQMRQVAFAM
jgi:hypothetical protein